MFESSRNNGFRRRFDALGRRREDILDWVALIPIDNNVFAYDIRLHPKTGSDVERCPWLQRLPGKNKYVCRIHKVKPTYVKNIQNQKSMLRKLDAMGLKDNHEFRPSVMQQS